MTSSGTFLFSPSIGDLALNAFDRIGVRSAGITREHMVNLRMEANLLQTDWANRGVNLWSVDLQSTTLTSGTATYTVDPSTIMILDAYIVLTSSATDRYISPISRTEYASIANKTTPGFPTQYWFDRLVSPTITLWPVPDASATYTLKYYRYRQIQDAEIGSATTPEMPYRFLDAFTAGLAYRLSRIYAPQLEQLRKADAQEAWAVAANQDTENVPLYVQPQMGGYYRL